MSGPPRITLDEFDGTHGFVKTKAFVNYHLDIAHHEPYQKVMLGNNKECDTQLPCVVFNEDIHLEKGHGYWFGGFDNEWEDGGEIQLKLHPNSWANEFYDPDDS